MMFATNRTRMRRVASALAATAAVAVLAACSTAAPDTAETAEAIDFPTKDITLIVPYGAGGPTDITARALAEDLESELGVTIIVENRPGASGITGLSEVAVASPDGYTIAYSTGDGFVQSELRTAPYTFDSFVPVAGTISQPYVLVTNVDSTIKEFSDILDLDRVTYAVTGIGTPTHLNTAVMLDQLGLEGTAVPFDGAGPAVQAIIGGQTNIALLDASVAMPQVEAGALTPLAVLTPDGEPLDYLDGVPTLAEEDIDTTDMTLTVWGVAAPTGTPDAVVQILRAAVLKAVEGKSFQEFTSANYMPLLTPEAEATWYEDLAGTAKRSKATLEKFGIELQ